MIITVFVYCEYYNFKFNQGSDTQMTMYEGIDTSSDINVEVWKLENYTSLILNSTGNNSDKKQAFALGYAEGYLLADQIDNFLNNVMLDLYPETKSFPDTLTQFALQQQKYINQQMKQHPLDLFWNGVGLVQEQLEGMKCGYNDRKPEVPHTIQDIYLLNSMQMVKTLKEKAYDTSNPLRSSAFVLTNFSSIILSRAAAHSYYSGFNRIYKRYQTSFNLQSSTNQITEFLSAPGIVHPLDGI